MAGQAGLTNYRLRGRNKFNTHVKSPFSWIQEFRNCELLYELFEFLRVHQFYFGQVQARQHGRIGRITTMTSNQNWKRAKGISPFVSAPGRAMVGFHGRIAVHAGL